MGTGYTRNDTGNNIADGNVINASDLDGEFDAVESAFNGSTGHSHDGTTGEGPQIDTAGIANDAVTGDKIDSTTTVTAASFVGPVTGNVTGNLTGDVTGNADTATALETSRTISLTGDVSGSASFDGTANASITATIADDSHNHVVGNIDGIAEYIQDTAGAMFSGNSESGISATYQDSDGTIDLNVNDPTISLTGAVTGSATMTNLGNVSISTTATSDPTLTLSGDASGSATFTNLGNATLSVTVADDSHNHVISNVDGLQTALNGKQATLGTGDVTSTMLASNSVTAAKIAAGAVGSSELASSGVSSGSYGSASAIPVLTIDVDGRVTSASTAAVTVPANCSNCSNYNNLTNKPTIPSNCDNGVASTATSQCDTYGGTALQCTYVLGTPWNSQCVSTQYNQGHTYGTRRSNGAAYLYTEKSGSSIRLRQKGLRSNCNCDCNC